ncbi:MAG: TIGR03936 family radical SAM-associated protein [Kineosporiaceae bacterium]
MPEGPPPEPAVQKLRLRYAKRGRLRFSSHRDFQRAFERALRRAGVPMAYSAGFNPHPKISYANAAATGAASEAEYVEISLTRRCDPERMRVLLDEALPPGLDVLEVVEARPGALADRLEASDWLVELPGADAAAVASAVEAFLAAGTVEVERLTKTGIRRFDAREAVLGLRLVRPGDADDTAVTERVGTDTSGSCAILRMVVRHTTPAVRPDDVLSALRAVADLAPPSPPRVTRLAQGPLDPGSGAVADPLTIDRDAVDA